MDDEYSIESLIQIFEKHAEEYDKWEKDHPNPYGKFSVSRALVTVVKEIKKLKENYEKSY